MSVEQTNIVDFISINAQDDVVLTISDHLDWQEEGKHLLLLQEKINSYLVFVESGELLRSYPKAQNRHPVISIKAMIEPSAEAMRFFSKVKNVAAGAGIGFQYERTPEKVEKFEG